MKKLTLTICLMLIAMTGIGQCFTFFIQTTPASCFTCYDGTASIIGLTGGCPLYYTYIWNGGYQLGNTTTQLSWGNYCVTISVPDSCCFDPDTTVCCFVNYLTGIVVNTINNSFLIYPNPATDKLTITNTSAQKQTVVSIYSMQGQQMMSAIFANQNAMQLDVSILSKGIYIIKVQSENGITNKKLIIQ